MKKTIYVYLCIIGLFGVITFSNCTRNYDFSLKNTLAIFMLKNENNYYFCLPIQYYGDYQIQSFEYVTGSVIIGNYEIALNRDELNISVYLNESPEEFGNSDGIFNQIYLEENGKVMLSKMNEPLAVKNDPENMMNYYYIFIEKYLNDGELKKIINEYKKGNVYSSMNIWYDLIIDNKDQSGSGITDKFELQDELVLDTSWYPPNLDFFKNKYQLK
jgi:hypothetical protein